MSSDIILVSSGYTGRLHWCIALQGEEALGHQSYCPHILFVTTHRLHQAYLIRPLYSQHSPAVLACFQSVVLDPGRRAFRYLFKDRFQYVQEVAAPDSQSTAGATTATQRAPPTPSAAAYAVSSSCAAAAAVPSSPAAAAATGSQPTPSAMPAAAAAKFSAMQEQQDDAEFTIPTDMRNLKPKSKWGKRSTQTAADCPACASTKVWSVCHLNIIFSVRYDVRSVQLQQ